MSSSLVSELLRPQRHLSHMVENSRKDGGLFPVELHARKKKPKCTALWLQFQFTTCHCNLHNATERPKTEHVGSRDFRLMTENNTSTINNTIEI